MAPRARRPLVSLEAQLQQLTLFSDLDAESENLEQLGPIIKSLDESNQQDAFLRHLNAFVKEKDNEIETVCNANHQDFVSAVDKLLKVRSGTVSLKHRIGELNEDVQAGGASLGSKKRQLLETQRVGQNIDEAIETLEHCLRVLDISNRVEFLIEQKRYYTALRSLEELESNHLKAILNHDFARLMVESIPLMRDQVKKMVTKEMKEWLFEVREKSRTVGKLALDSMENRQKRWKVKSLKDPMLSLAKVNSAIELVVNERIEYNFVDNEHVKIDFKPLYQCIHIYDVLDLREELQTNYQEDRRAQANLLLSQGLSFSPSNPTFPALLEEVVGFFIVEHHVLKTSPQGFRADQEVDDLWDNMCERVIDIVSFGLRDCKDTKIFVGTKAIVGNFIMTLEGYNFTVGKLNSLLLTLFERYVSLLRNRFSVDFQQAVKENQHQPMIVNNLEELNKVLNVCWLKGGDAQMLQRQSFPLSLPFSQTYPLCCMDIRSLVDQYYTFSDGFSQHHRDIDDILKKSLDELLVQQVSSSIRQSVEKTVNLSQIAQIVVNAEHFKLACSELEKLLATLRAPHRGGRLRLDASSHFSTTLDLAQRRIDSAISAKLDQFLSLADYDWTPKEAKKEGQEADHLSEMVQWLSTMMESVLVTLPAATKMQAYKAAFQYMGDQLLNEHLLSKEDPSVNMFALQNLNTDVNYLNNYAAKLGDSTFESVFAEIRQTLSLFFKDSISDYTNSTTRATRFPEVKPSKVAIILEKLAKYHHSRNSSGDLEIANKRRREAEIVGRIRRG